jgi:hypothetical protein
MYILILFSKILCAKYNQNDQVKEDLMDRVCSMHGEKGIAYRILVGKTE